MIYWFLLFGFYTGVLAVIHYFKGSTFAFVVNVVCALINFAEFFYWS